MSTSEVNGQISTVLANFKRDLDTNGSKINFEVDYAAFKNKQATFYNTFFFDSLPNYLYTEKLKQDGHENINIKSAQINFTRIYKEKRAKIEAGIKLVQVATDNESGLFRWDNEKWKVDSLNGYHFVLQERIFSAYLNYNRRFKTWSFEAGLRAEQTNSTARLIKPDSVVHRNYFYVFPSLQLKKSINKNNVLTFAYGRRIVRPNYGNLAPFRTFGNPNAYFEGNPYLLPQVSDVLQLSHAFKGKLITSFTYNHVKDLITELTRVMPGGISVYSAVNITLQNYLAFSVTNYLSPAKWWTFNYTLTGYYSHLSGYYRNETIDNAYSTAQLNIMNVFNISKNLSAEIGGRYISKRIYVNAIMDPKYYVNAGLLSYILQKKASFKISEDDIFKTEHYLYHLTSKRTIRFADAYPTGNSVGIARILRVSFSWHFGGKEIKRQIKSGIDAERDRAN